MSQSSIQTSEQDDEISVLGMLVVLLKRKKAIFGATLAGAVLSVGISLLLPVTYQASTTLLPPERQQSSAAAMLSQLGGVAGGVAGASGIKSPSDLYIGLLKSRRIADKLVARFDLKKVYDTSLQEIARSKLAGKTDMNSGKDGLIVIAVEDQDKNLAAQLANGYAAELLNLTRNLAVTEASQRRVFYERELLDIKEKLAKAEAALKGGLDRNGVISVETEGKAVLETMARLRAQISAKEIELNSMRPFMTTVHPDFRRAEEELSSLRQELSALQNGRNGGETKPSKEGGLENIQRLRDLKYYQTLYDLLARQYEAARIDEAKSPGIIQVLDPAVVPERKYKPKRTVIVLSSTAICFFLACLWALLSDAVTRGAAAPATRGLYQELLAAGRFRN